MPGIAEHQRLHCRLMPIQICFTVKANKKKNKKLSDDKHLRRKKDCRYLIEISTPATSSQESKSRTIQLPKVGHFRKTSSQERPLYPATSTNHFPPSYQKRSSTELQPDTKRNVQSTETLPKTIPAGFLATVFLWSATFSPPTGPTNYLPVERPCQPRKRPCRLRPEDSLSFFK